MPHLTLEYTNNLALFNAGEALKTLNIALIESGQFEATDIKSRAVKIGTFLVGLSSEDQAFVHVKLAILSGRPLQIRHALSESLLAALTSTCDWPEKPHVQLCVEVQEIERSTYSKIVLRGTII